MAEERALVPVVGKALEVALVVLLVAVLTGSLFGTAVPAYRSAVGDEVGDRVLQHAASEVEGAASEAGGATDESSADATEAVAVEVEVTLPETLRGSRYRVRAVERTLRLDHPHAAVGGRARLSLPADARLSGTWRSGNETVVSVVVSDGETRVRLVNR